MPFIIFLFEKKKVIHVENQLLLMLALDKIFYHLSKENKLKHFIKLKTSVARQKIIR